MVSGTCRRKTGLLSVDYCSLRGSEDNIPERAEICEGIALGGGKDAFQWKWWKHLERYVWKYF